MCGAEVGPITDSARGGAGARRGKIGPGNGLHRRGVAPGEKKGWVRVWTQLSAKICNKVYFYIERKS